jgi:hypothetical protein
MVWCCGRVSSRQYPWGKLDRVSPTLCRRNQSPFAAGHRKARWRSRLRQDCPYAGNQLTNEKGLRLIIHPR